MPGEYLTLDIKANDQATPALRSVATTADEAARALGRLTGEASKQASDLAKLTSAQARLASAQARGLRESRASEKGSVDLARARAQLATAEARGVTATARSNEAAARVVGAQARAAAAINRTARASTQAASAQVRLAGAQRVLGSTTGTSSRGFAQIAQSVSRTTASFAPLVTTLTGSLGSLGAFGPVGIAVGAALGGIAVAAAVTTRALKLQFTVLKSAITTALAFEQSIARVGAVSAASAGQLEQLRRAAIEGGASTLFTAQESAEALRFLAQAGLSVDQATQALPQTLALAAAGSLDLAKAADITTNILTGYNFQVSELGRVNDVLVKAANSSNTSIKELGTSFSFTAGVASATGQEFEEITSILAVLANNGIKGSKSGRAVANAISRIQKPTAAGVKVLKDLDINLAGVDGKAISLAETLRRFEKQNASTAQVLTFFGEVAGRSLITVLNSGTKSVDRYNERLRAASGAALEFQKILQDTASAQIKIFQSTLETLSIAVGERFTPNIKASAQVLSAQGTQLLRNERFLNAFKSVSDEAVLATASLVRILANSIPAFVTIGSAVLTVVANLKTFVRGALGVVSVFSPVIRGLVIFAFTAQKVASALSGLNSDMSDTQIIGDSLRTALLNAADGLTRVSTASVLSQKASSIMSAGFKSARLALEDFLQVDFEDAQRRITNLLAFNTDPVITEELQKQRELAAFELRLAKERDASKRVQIQLEEDIRKVREDSTDAFTEDLKVQALQETAARRLEELNKKTSKRRSGAAREDTAAILEQIRISTLLAQTDDARTRIALQLEAKLAQIVESKASSAVKAAQTNLAEIESQREIADLEVQIASRRRTNLIEVQSAQADLLQSRIALREQETLILGALTDEQRARRIIADETDKLTAIELQRKAAVKQVASEGLEGELLLLRLRGVESKAELDRQTVLAQTAQARLAQEDRFTSARIASLEQVGGVEARIAAIRLKAGQEIIKLGREDIDGRTRALEVANAQRAADAEILAIRRQIAVQRITSIGGGVSAGISTDVSPIFEQATREREAVASAQIAELERAKTTAQAQGASTALLERRIELLREESAAEQRGLELQRQRIEGLAQVGAGLADVATQAAIVAKLGFDNEDAYTAFGSAIGAAAGIAGALATGLGLSAKTSAKLQAAFNAAAAIAAGAGYAASGFTAVNLLGAAIQHGVAATKFAAIAGSSVAVPSIARGGSVGSGSQSASGGRDAQDRASAAGARERAQTAGLVINVDFGSSTQLSRAPDVAREVAQAVGAANGQTYQPGAQARRRR